MSARHDDSRRTRWLLPALAAVAVLAVILGVLAWQRDDETPAPPAAGGPGGGGVQTGLIAATGYHVRDATHLAIVYTNGVPECYGTAGTPVVEESPDAVTVTIPRLGPDPTRGGTKEGRLCIDIALVDSVDVTLDAPLAGRTVRDGSRDGAVLPPQSLPGDAT